MSLNPYTLPDSLLEQLLQEDAPQGDATTHALGIGGRRGRMLFAARHEMRLCGSEEAVRMGALRGLRCVGDVAASGSALAAGTPILTLEGDVAGLQRVWKTAQTFMEYLSGIASGTAAIVSAAQRGRAGCAVACTRKNFPGTKTAAIKAVLAGGGVPHRLSLSETLLVFAEHRVFLDEEPAATVGRLHQQWPERAVVVEVASVDEALLWASAGVDVLQLEKFTPASVAALRAALPAGTRARLAAAGGVKADNAEDYARAGADFLVSSAPYFAPPRDVAVRLTVCD
ncbi:ModD protein [Viridibacterium curvum]|uniref:Putative pyrophosphorylase ModD n=1 Tax=Viridibacterium curvum TaxID=1101404 RepID=A0ABP9R6S9_9RHOO